MSDRHEEQSHGAPNRRATRAGVVTVATLLVALWLPFVAQWFLPVPKLSSTEKRFRAPWPVLEATRESLVTWPSRAEAWYDDHLGFRDWLIGAWANLNIRLFGVSPIELTVVGRDGWLFLGDRDAIAHYRGLDPLSPQELEVWRRVTVERRDWLAERGIAYLLVLVPDKHLVYREHMPDSLPRSGESHPLEQLSSHLQATTDVDVLDLRPALLAAKARGRVYHKTDSHWNDVGAWEAYRAIHERLQRMLPALADVPAAATDPGRRVEPGLGLANAIAMADAYPEEILEARLVAPRATLRPDRAPEKRGIAKTLRPIRYEHPDRSRPRAVMFRDSFANALIPYLAEDFSRVAFVWDRDLDPELVLRERPDVVIQEIVGRFLGRRPKGIDEVRARSSRLRDR